MAQAQTVRDLDLSPDEQKRLMMIMQVGAVPPDMPADMALQMLEASDPKRVSAPAVAEAPAPQRSLWKTIRGPIVIVAFGGLIIYANYFQ
ncbi:MAG: hypothetical protein AAGA71_09910 [Pseudomonadota bacterium]